MVYHPKRYLRWLCVMLTVVMLSSCASLFGAPEGIEEKPREDVVLAMKIKAVLIKTSQLNAAAIDVEASHDRIRLSGFVDTASQRQLASDVTNWIAGVKEVINEIEVK